MTKKLGEEPAFPSSQYIPGGGTMTGLEFPPKIMATGGMSKREWFAGMALQILLKHGTEAFPQFKDVAEECARFANALLLALEKSK